MIDGRWMVVPALALVGAVAAAEKAASSPPATWAQWRGPQATGVAPAGNPPVTWGEESNVRWKLTIPGKGLSTPVVYGDRLFLTTAVPHGEAVAVDGGHQHADGAHDNMDPTRRHRFVVLAVDRHSGKILWQRVVRDARPHEGTHVTGSWASNSAVTDGRHVFASFGSQGLYAMTVEGEPVWEKDLGDMQTRHEHGEGSSPALDGDTLVVNWDHQGQSFLVALDKATGKERWKVERDEITSWSTPLVVAVGDRRQVVVSATGRVRGYDLADGKVIWEAAGLSRNVVASPVAADGMVFVGNSYDGRAMLAIRLADARGDITATDAVVWRRDRDTPYVPSPILYDDALCFLKHLNPFLTCVDPASGKPLFGPVRLSGLDGVFASPSGVRDRFYVPSRNGATAVISKKDGFRILGINRLDDSFSASPVIVGDVLYLRGEASLYALEATD